MNIGDERNMQPVKPIIIQVPTNYSVFSYNFHNYVLTNAIVHELGHAIARLMDEYDYLGTDNGIWLYEERFRNISELENGRLKWHLLIDLNPRYLSPTPHQASSLNNDQKLGFFQNPHFFNSRRNLQKYYIPTVNSTMRGDGRSENIQFGPVNTYHMEGSFRTRIGNIQAQDPSQSFSSTIEYEWRGYTFRDFIYDWPPSRFE
jgi:hypothetical protein